MPFPVLLLIPAAILAVWKIANPEEGSGSSGGSSREPSEPDGSRYAEQVTAEQHQMGVHINCDHD